MPSTSPHLDRFLAALHRRLLIVYLLEKTGVGVLAGSLVAGVLIALLLSAGRPALEPTMGAIVVGAFIGLLTALKRRPTRLAAATEADRQLGLSDLLSTALSVGSRSRESDRDGAAAPWLQTVTALADAACRSHTPSQVVLRRRSARAWTGIALSAALATTVAALVNESPRAGASGDSATVADLAQGRRPSATEARTTQTVVEGAPAVPQRRAADPDSSAANPLPSDDAGVAKPDSSSTSNPSAHSNNSSSGSNTGTAPGRANAARPSADAEALAHDAAVAGRNPVGNTTAGGAGPSTMPAVTNQDAAPSGSAGGGTAPSTPPWRADTWPADVRRAREAVDAGRVPAAHRDLVREYFNRGP